MKKYIAPEFEVNELKTEEIMLLSAIAEIFEVGEAKEGIKFTNDYSDYNL